MKIFRELYFRGTKEQLELFVKNIHNYAVGEWVLIDRKDEYKKYLFFEYRGVQVEKARVSIFVGDNTAKGELKVGNIIPIEKNELTVEEYNSVLLNFYESVIKPYKEKNHGIEILEPSDDIFNPREIISEHALQYLENFCNCANKSTGSSHPEDQKRWFKFVCQTVDDNMMFDSTTLANFLQDENYWGKKEDDFIGVMGDFAWDEEQAWELASEYEELCAILKYYKETRGI